MIKKSKKKRNYDDIVKDVINACDVIKILDYYNVKYTPSKDELVMACIFHSLLKGKTDKNPSLSVNSIKKLFRCWSCPASGNIISLVQQLEITYGKSDSCTYNEALLKVCEICDIGIEGIFKVDKSKAEEFTINDIVYGDKVRYQDEIFSEKILEKFYLKKHRYFIDIKKFKETTLKHFEMGYGFKGTEQDRIVFPIRNAFGGLVGWSGRTVLNKKPKWLHQPSERFLKELNLYNIDKALPYIIDSGEVIVVESIGNVMRFFEADIYNVVAILGNQISDTQIALLKEYADVIKFVFDNDSGGKTGINIAINKLFDSDKEVYIGIYDFGVDNKGYALDVADVNPSLLFNIDYVEMFEYIDSYRRVVDILKDGLFNNEEIILPNGDTILCTDELDNGYNGKQITSNDMELINTVDKLFGIKDITSV